MNKRDKRDRAILIAVNRFMLWYLNTGVQSSAEAYRNHLDELSGTWLRNRRELDEA